MSRPPLSRGLTALPARPGALKRCLSMLASLGDLGWHASARAKAPVDAEGHPLPWYAYPAILWLGPRLAPSLRVFEYGAGNSTLWYAERCAAVTSVEHDPGWVATLRQRLPANVELLHRATTGDAVDAPDDDPYVTALEDPGAFDIVVIDGRARLACARRVLPRLAPNALAILDNADRRSLAAILALAAELHLARIDFTGPAPGSGRLGTTTVLGRDLGRWLQQAPELPQLGYDGDDRT